MMHVQMKKGQRFSESTWGLKEIRDGFLYFWQSLNGKMRKIWATKLGMKTLLLKTKT